MPDSVRPRMPRKTGEHGKHTGKRDQDEWNSCETGKQCGRDRIGHQTTQSQPPFRKPALRMFRLPIQQKQDGKTGEESRGEHRRGRLQDRQSETGQTACGCTADTGDTAVVPSDADPSEQHCAEQRETPTHMITPFSV